MACIIDIRHPAAFSTEASTLMTPSLNPIPFDPATFSSNLLLFSLRFTEYDTHMDVCPSSVSIQPPSLLLRIMWSSSSSGKLNPVCIMKRSMPLVSKLMLEHMPILIALAIDSESFIEVTQPAVPREASGSDVHVRDEQCHCLINRFASTMGS